MERESLHKALDGVVDGFTKAADKLGETIQDIMDGTDAPHYESTHFGLGQKVRFAGEGEYLTVIEARMTRTAKVLYTLVDESDELFTNVDEDTLRS